MIDLRSDTVTLPTAEMRKVIASADVGDDVYGEDPMVNRLQDQVAELMGKEAALFVASGTMSNQVAIRTHTVPGDEVILDYNCHIFNYESGAGAALSGVQLHTIIGDHGILEPKEIADAIRPDDHHYAPTALIALENTHNRAGGIIYPLETIQDIGALAHKHGIGLHLDGARLMNAVVASGIPAATWAKSFDSISLCLSKGLGAPVGSVLSGSRDFIQEAHRYRKMLGGGMRQAGILAAAGIYALDHHVNRLAEDHENAQILARAMENMGLLKDDRNWTQTNMVVLAFPRGNAYEIETKLKAAGLLVSAMDAYMVRMVTHLGIDRGDVDTSIEILQRVLG